MGLPLKSCFSSWTFALMMTKGITQKQAFLMLVITCSSPNWTLGSWIFNLVFQAYFFWCVKWWMPGTKMTCKTISINCKILKLLLNYHIGDCRAFSIIGVAATSLLGGKALRKYSCRSAAWTDALTFRACTWLHAAQIRILIVALIFPSPSTNCEAPRICVCNSSSRFSVAGLLLCKQQLILLDRTQSRKLLSCYLWS